MKKNLLYLYFSIAVILFIQTANAACPLVISAGNYPAQNCGNIQLQGTVVPQPGITFTTIWTTSALGGTFSNPNSLNAIYTPSQTDLNAGQITITLRVSSSCGLQSVSKIISITKADDGNPCTIDACNPSTGIVTHTNVNDFTPAPTDNNACTDDFCIYGNTYYLPVIFDDGNACTIDFCNTVNGAITNSYAGDGTPGESDGNACTSDVCISGTTVHSTSSSVQSVYSTFPNVMTNLGGFTQIPITISGSGLINSPADLSVLIDIGMPANAIGNLTFQLLTPGGQSLGLFDQPSYIIFGLPFSNTDNLLGQYTFNPVFNNPISTTPTGTNYIIPGNYSPTDHFGNLTNWSGIFFPFNPNGTWFLQVTNPIVGTPLVLNECKIIINSLVNDSNACTLDACDPFTGNVSHTALADGSPGDNDGNACTSDICIGGTTIHTALQGGLIPIAQWSFESIVLDSTYHLVPTLLSGSYAADIGNQTVGSAFTGFHPNFGNNNTWATFTGNGSTQSLWSNSWAVSDYYQFRVNTTSYTDINISFDQTSSNTGPRDFRLQYSIDGVNYNNFSNYSVSVNTWNNINSSLVNHYSFDLHTITALNGISNAYFRIVCITNTSASGGTLALGGASRVDNFTVSGKSVQGTILDDRNLCTIDACDPVIGITHSPLPLSDDFNLCTNDVCDPMTGLTLHIPLDSIDDGLPCTIDACDDSTGIITHFNPIPAPIIRVNFTTGGSTFSNSVTLCQGNSIALSVTNSNLFTNIHWSNGQNGSPIAVTPNSSIVYTVTVDNGDSCSNTASISVTVFPVDDNNPCTEDICFPTLGAFHNPLTNTGGGASDNLPCTQDNCVNGTTVHIISAGGGIQDDNNPCTAELCNSTHMPLTNIGGGATDNNFCTQDNCQNGITVHPLLPIDDGNPCTFDFCSEFLEQVTHNALSNLGGGDSDNNPCTRDDCDSGFTVHNTIPGCSPCANLNDSNACTNDFCISGVVYHNTIGVDDGNFCTIDACDPTTGLITHTPKVNAHFQISSSCLNSTLVSFTDQSTGSPAIWNWQFGDGTANFLQNPVHTYSNAGIYAVTLMVADSNGCADTINIPVSIFILNDGNSCTIDFCDTITNSIIHTPIPGCTPCSNLIVSATVTTPILCYNQTGCVTVTASGGSSTYFGTGTQCGISAGTGLTFQVSDSNGCTATSNPVTLTSPPKLEVSITSTNAVCFNNGTATAHPTGGTPTYQYAWTPSGGTGQTATSLSSGNYNVLVTDTNGCTANASVFIVSSGLDSLINPPVLSGPGYVCKGRCETYSIPPVPGALSYQWVLPNGATGNSNGPSITVCFNTQFTSSGNICVITNLLCTSLTSCKNVKPAASKPAKPQTITGPSFVCAPSNSAVYCCSTVTGATSYQWTVYGNSYPSLSFSAGQGTNCVTVNVPSGYNGAQKIQVRAVNCKGSSFKIEKSITVKKAPSQPGSINGPSSICRSQIKTYSISSVNGATSYNWFINDSCAFITSGQNTTSVNINFGSCSSHAVTIGVVASNTCGSSLARTKSINIMNCKIENPALTTTPTLNSIAVFPNPTSGKTMLSLTASQDGNYSLKVCNILGEVIIRDDLKIPEGSYSKEINLGNVAKGMYFLTLQSENSEAQTLRIVVE